MMWMEVTHGDLGPCRVQLTKDSAWDDTWEILRWESQNRPILRKRAYTGRVREEHTEFKPEQIEVKNDDPTGR